ncbi:M48 family metallopeptidase [soil metagenome]
MIRLQHRHAGLVVGLAAAAAMTGCAYNEALGRDQLLMVNDTALTKAAAQAWTQTLNTERVSRDPVANERVRVVGGRIVQAAGLGNQHWEYVVFENDDVNAFVLPGGRMGVNTGLLRLVRNDDQLAAVIGHEVAHTAAHHAAERASQENLTSIGLAIGKSVLGSQSNAGQMISAYGGAGAQLGILLPFSRQHELEADRLGVDYMQRAGYDPRQAVALWRMMASQSKGGPPQFASTHPSDQTRIAALEAYLKQKGWS